MNWIVKAAAANVVDILPQTDRIHYFAQRRITGSLPANEVTFRRRRRRALAHLQAFEEHGPDRPLSAAVFYEFGAGWDLTIPLTFWALGVERQILVDVDPHLRPELVNATLRRLREGQRRLERAAGRPVRGVGPSVRSQADLGTRFGIEYRAPCDARDTGLEPASVDFVSSTSTLEHIPEPHIGPILAECRRLLRPQGILSCRIDMRDHFAYADPDVSPYNFLRFSPGVWRLLNSRLLYLNRLRLPDYLRLIESAGFELLTVDTRGPRPKERKRLETMKLARSFRAYSWDDLAAGSVSVVARPRATF